MPNFDLVLVSQKRILMFNLQTKWRQFDKHETLIRCDFHQHIFNFFTFAIQLKTKKNKFKGLTFKPSLDNLTTNMKHWVNVISINVFFYVYNTTKDKRSILMFYLQTKWRQSGQSFRHRVASAKSTWLPKVLLFHRRLQLPTKNQRLIFNLFVTENVSFIVYMLDVNFQFTVPSRINLKDFLLSF